MMHLAINVRLLETLCIVTLVFFQAEMFLKKRAESEEDRNQCLKGYLHDVAKFAERDCLTY